jgi:uncharacterized small protein (DUF1192 family)
MTRFALAATTALILAASPAVAQTTAPQTTAPQAAGSKASGLTPAQSPARTAAAEPGSEAWLRQRGETYSAASEAQQDPAEVAATAELNARIAARNAAAERTESESLAVFEAESARWRTEAARLETERAQWEADVAAANAARARYEREHAAWEAEMAACRRAGRVCLTAAPQY